MQQSGFPAKFVTPFAANAAAGNTNTIPATTSTPGAASLSIGFPPITFQPVASGGIPPSGKDFNGLFNQITAALQAYQAGAVALFDATFAAAIGGYPKGSLLASSATPHLFWTSTGDYNSTNPDSSSAANWVGLLAFGNFMPPQQGGGINQAADKLYIGLSSTSTAVRVTVDATDLGELAAFGNLGIGNWMEQYSTLPANGSETISLSFTAPRKGRVVVIASANLAAPSAGNNLLSVAVNGNTGSSDAVQQTSAMTNHSCFEVTAGEAVAISSYFGVSGNYSVTVGHTLTYIYIPE